MEQDPLNQLYNEAQPTFLRPEKIWSNSDDLLEMLLSESSNRWPISVPLKDSQPLRDNGQTWPEPSEDQDTPGRNAMRQMSSLILDMSSTLTTEIQNTGITSAFLDTCMHVYFEKFNSSFPILHAATFMARNTSNPLLLNIMAVGSLFIGTRDAIAKGEALWRLAHTVVATSWQALLTTRGIAEECDGTQLVLTALIGQTYAMLSRNESLRMTSQTFHGLGLYWARLGGMSELAPLQREHLPTLGSPEDTKAYSWKTWALREVQIRAMLGHYLIDGLISQFSGQSTCFRHVTNSLPIPAPDTAFAARTADAWIVEMQKSNDTGQTFRETFLSLFATSTTQTSRPLRGFSVGVVLEGLQSLVSENQVARGPAVGAPTTTEIVSALLRLHDEHINCEGASSTEKTEHLIRWHTILLNLATPSALLCRRICNLFGIQQRLYAALKYVDEEWTLESWACSAHALRALLHAMAIEDLTENLPLGRSHSIYLPPAVFAVATVYSAQCMAGLPSVTIPEKISWHALWAARSRDGSSSVEETQSPMAQFLDKRQANDLASSSARNLLYNLNSLQAMLSSISLRWGVSYEMDLLLRRWTTIASGGSVSTPAQM